MNPFIQYHSRYLSLKNELDLTGDAFLENLNKNPGSINNLFMAGLGMGTLFLRMGAVIQLSEKLHDGDTSNDALFLKQVMDNLRETLPSDTNWKNLWYASMQPNSPWASAIPKKDNSTLLDRFVTFRNKFVHQYIRIVPEHAAALSKGMDILDAMSKLYSLFEGGDVVLEDSRFFWKKQGHSLLLHPFVQEGDKEGLPYLFQGLYEQKTKAKFINTFLGDETVPAQNAPITEKFEPIQQALRGGAGQVFDHADRIKYYLECFVGRDNELQAVLDWVNSSSPQNVLPIYAEAGMGKGALTAGIIDALMHADIPVMYHFCGSGMANNLHAVLYHLILQGKKMPGMNGAGVWQIEDEKLQKKMDRLPSRYYDAIHLFQALLGHCYQPPRKYADKPLVVIVDALDEAAVANAQLKITDWFYTYNDKDEIEDEWKSPKSIRWIFTYRSLPGQSKNGFRLGGRFQLQAIPELQPLQGLTENAVRAALEKFNVSDAFIKAVLQKGAVA
jgi:hypothetical protein